MHFITIYDFQQEYTLAFISANLYFRKKDKKGLTVYVYYNIECPYFEYIIPINILWIIVTPKLNLMINITRRHQGDNYYYIIGT